MNQAALKFYLDYLGDYGDKYDSLYVPWLQIQAAGLRTAFVEVDYQYPPEQRAEEIGQLSNFDRRLAQALNTIKTMWLECRRLGLAQV